MNRAEWLEARRKGIGGTDAAAILGLSKWRTAIDVWEDKLGLSPEKPETVQMRWGKALEDAVATAYTAETGIAVRKVPGIRRARHVKDFPMIGSIDRLSSVVYSADRPDDFPRVVEIKTSRMGDGFAGADEWRDLEPEKRVPADYYVQVQHYLEVMDAPVADVAALFSGSDFRVIEIPRDRDFGADLRSEEGAFWRDYVLAETQPPATGDDLAFLARKYPRSNEDEIVATPELAAIVDEILGIGEDIKAKEKLRDDLRATVEEYLGENGRLLTPRATVSWRAYEKTTVGWKELAGSLERMVRELAEAVAIDWMTGRAERGVISREVLPYIPGIPDAYGPGLDGLRDLYTATSSVRPFRVDRKKEGAK